VKNNKFQAKMYIANDNFSGKIIENNSSLAGNDGSFMKNGKSQARMSITNSNFGGKQ